MHPRPDRPLQKRDRFNLALVSAIGMLTILTATCGACASALLPVDHSGWRTPREQYSASAQVRVKCSYPSPDRLHTGDDAADAILNTLIPNIEATYYGTGVLVSSDRALTNAHVVDCKDKTLGNGTLKAMAVNVGDDIWRDANVEVVLPARDLARVLMTYPLSVYIPPPVIGPTPVVGDVVCMATAVPLWNVRCGRVQPQGNGTTFYTDLYVQHGNSGSAVSDEQGRLVGLMHATLICEFGVPCEGAVMTIDSDLEWLVRPPRA